MLKIWLKSILKGKSCVPKLTISDFSALGIKNHEKSDTHINKDLEDVENIETEINIDYVTLDDCQRFQEHSRLQKIRKSGSFDAWSATNTNR